MKTQNKTALGWLTELGSLILTFGAGYLFLSYCFGSNATMVATIMTQFGMISILIRALLQERAKKSENPQD